VSSLQLPRNQDINGAHQEGFGTRQVTIRNGRRESAATAFLDPARNRKNLTIVSGVLADKLILDGHRARGIELVGKDGRVRIDARKEVILSAGAIGSPTILMRSGIGPGEELQKHGIAVAHALDGVGRNLRDHVGAFVKFMSGTTIPYGFSPRAVPRLAWQSLRYLLTRQGFWASNVMESAGFLRSEPGLDRPDLQFMFLPGHRGPAGQFFAVGHGYSLTSVVLRPKSHGYVGLTGPAADAPPLIDPRFFSDEADLDLLLKGVKLARRILDTPAFEPYRGEEIWPGPDIVSDADLREAIKDAAMTVFHPTCTCAMGTGGGAVVDPELRVRGMDGLRVVDGSIMPKLVGGNTNAPIIMIGEKAADIILGKPPLPAAGGI
jgi:choline dehydrogenase-like flavoprotein